MGLSRHWMLENVKILKSNSAQQLENVLSLLGVHADPYLDYLAHIEFNVVGLRAACFPSPPFPDALPSPHMLRLRPEAALLQQLSGKSWETSTDQRKDSCKVCPQDIETMTFQGERKSLGCCLTGRGDGISQACFRSQ